MKLKLLPQAEADLEGIALYIAADNPRAALAVVASIERHFQQLVDHPYSGMNRDDIAPGIRHLVTGNYVALYRVAADAVEIIRVLHGRRSIGPESVS